MKSKALAILLTLFLVYGSVSPAYAGEEIRIITPQWEGQTNADGTGLFFEILKAVYGPEGIALRFKFAPWKRCQTAVTAGLEDAMLCEWKDHAKAQRQLTPTYPLYIEQTAAVVKKASDMVWNGVLSLDHKRVVWLRGYNYHTNTRMKGVQLADWHEVDSYKEAWRHLNSDRFDVYLDALIDIEAYMRAQKIDARRYKTRVLWKDKSYVAFSDTPKSKKLIAIYDGRIRQMLRSGKLAGIYHKWHLAFDPADWQAGD